VEVGVLQFHLSYIFVSSDFTSVIFSAPASATATMRVIATVSVATCCCLFVDGQDTLCVLSSKPISRPFLSGLESDDAKQALMINKLVSCGLHCCCRFLSRATEKWKTAALKDHLIVRNRVV